MLVQTRGWSDLSEHLGEHVGEDKARALPRPMRKLIRSKATKEFLTRDGTWTVDYHQAAIFEDQVRAFAVKRDLQLTGVEIYYLFGEKPDAQYDFAVALE